MKLDLWKCEEESSLKKHIEVDPDCFFSGLSDDYVGFGSWSGNLNIDYDITVDYPNIIIAITAAVELDIECSRCGDIFHTYMTTEEEILVMIKGDKKFLLKNQDEDGTDDLIIKDNRWLYSDEYIRQKMELVLPNFPLCSPDCAGVCPVCGNNRNSGGCKCGEGVSLNNPSPPTMKDIMKKH